MKNSIIVAAIFLMFSSAQAAECHLYGTDGIGSGNFFDQMASSQVATTTAGLQQQCLTSCDQVQSRNPSVSAVCLFRDGSIGADGGPAEWFLKSYIGT